MKTINFTTRFAFFMLLTSAFVVLQSCVSYYPASYVSDGIYVRSDNRAYQTYSNGSSFYSSYFAGKAAQWENNNTEYEITNSDNYTGESNPAWGQNPQNVSINVYNSPAWGSGGYDPFFYDYMYHYDHWSYNGRFFGYGWYNPWNAYRGWGGPYWSWRWNRNPYFFNPYRYNAWGWGYDSYVYNNSHWDRFYRRNLNRTRRGSTSSKATYRDANRGRSNTDYLNSRSISTRSNRTADYRRTQREPVRNSYDYNTRSRSISTRSNRTADYRRTQREPVRNSYDYNTRSRLSTSESWRTNSTRRNYSNSNSTLNSPSRSQSRSSKPSSYQNSNRSSGTQNYSRSSSRSSNNNSNRSSNRPSNNRSYNSSSSRSSSSRGSAVRSSGSSSRSSSSGKSSSSRGRSNNQ